MKRFYSITFFLLFSGIANGTPMTWYLHDVTFDDGTNATGSYVYDADVNVWSEWNVSVEDGTLPGFTYLASNSSLSPNHPASASNASFLKTDPTQRYLNLVLLAPMTNAGGDIDLLVATAITSQDSGSYECDNCLTLRAVNAGYVSSSPVPAPEPSTIAVIAVGLIGLAVSRKRRF